jgi:uncharacterized repeat protein (TIGR01451 family)
MKLNTARTAIAFAIAAAAAQGVQAQAATAAGTSITNQASASYVDSTLATRSATSNTVVTTVQQIAAVTISAGTSKTAAAGATVTYAHTITNSGNGPDSYVLSASNTGAFQMTGVTYYLANDDGTAKGGPITTVGQLAAGASVNIIAVATLPGAAATGSTNSMVVTATSTFTGTVNALATDVTTVSAGAKIDVTNNTAGTGAPGAGPGAEQTAVVTNIAAVGGKTTFTLHLNNGGGSADTFNLAASFDPAFGSTTLPAGWTVVFKDANGNVITNRTVAAGSSAQVTAEVTIPSGATPSTTDIYFRASSPTTNVSDTVHDAINVVANGTELTLAKSQALDADCDGVADTAFSDQPITVGAVPGACIRYQIVATNTGATNVGSVVVKDDTPANTTYTNKVAASTTLGLITGAPFSGLTGTIYAAVGLLTPGQSATVKFGVKINP